jgi:hypothetical protein
MSAGSIRYQKDPAMVGREIVGEMILVPVRQNAGNLESIYTLNETAAFAWNLLDGQRTLAEISAEIAAEFEVSPEQAQADLLELVAQLLEINAIQQVA